MKSLPKLSPEEIAAADLVAHKRKIAAEHGHFQFRSRYEQDHLGSFTSEELDAADAYIAARDDRGEQ